MSFPDDLNKPSCSGKHILDSNVEENEENNIRLDGVSLSSGNVSSKRPRLEDELQIETNHEERLQNLQNQIDILANLVSNTPYIPLHPEQRGSPFSQLASGNRILDFPDLHTDVDEKRTVRPALPEHLKVLHNLQRFDSLDWNEVRYSNALRNFSAFPGFIELKVNEELCHLDKKKDPFLSVERVLAGLSNALLVQKDLLKNITQSIVDWAFASPAEVTPDALFGRLSESFASGSHFQRNFDLMSQIICGKRADCVESRRDRLLAELTNKNVQSALRKVPPSMEYLFDKDKLSSLMHSLGGSQVWLNTPSYATSKKTPIKLVSNRKSEIHTFCTVYKRWVANVCYYTIILKIADLIETVVFVLRKKNSQVTILHVYHHISTVLIGMTFPRYFTIEMAYSVPILNCSIHVIMYSYYFLSNFEGPIKEAITPFKHYITIAQMAQFVIMVIQAVPFLSEDCYIPNIPLILMMFNMLFNLGLFLNFYKRTYIDKKKKDA